MLTPKTIENTANESGYKYVTSASAGPNGGGQTELWRARVQQKSSWWYGTARRTPLEAAQDYCDYINSSVAPVSKTLINAGHTTVKPDTKKPVHPKRAEAYRLLAEAAADEGNDPSGYVYCISDGTAMKLGKSADHPQNRLKGLQTGNPRMLSLMGFKRVNDRTAAESELHAKFHSMNILGEWFDFDKAILKEFV